MIKMDNLVIMTYMVSNSNPLDLILQTMHDLTLKFDTFLTICMAPYLRKLL